MRINASVSKLRAGADPGSGILKNNQKSSFLSRFKFPKMFPNVIVPEAHGLYAPGLALLGSPRLASASLALPAPATTAAALRAARPPSAARLLLRGAGKASEADPRRGKSSKARPGAFHGFFLFCLFGPWALYLAYGQRPPRYFFILVAPVALSYTYWRPHAS